MSVPAKFTIHKVMSLQNRQNDQQIKLEKIATSHPISPPPPPPPPPHTHAQGNREHVRSYPATADAGSKFNGVKFYDVQSRLGKMQCSVSVSVFLSPSLCLSLSKYLSVCLPPSLSLSFSCTYALCVCGAVNTQGFMWKFFVVFYVLYINFHLFI